MTRLLLTLIRGYQMSFSKVLPPSCRYYPSCSHYTYEAVERYGWLRGGWIRSPRAATILSPDSALNTSPEKRT